eukprot:GHVU01071784.1.p1 GENE.GHVU01071784.1~~GHVU01071784.1.p1  ORF type:complete len:163 (+),score=17.19 GHVU01071784.1:680-1168(+)
MGSSPPLDMAMMAIGIALKQNDANTSGAELDEPLQTIEGGRTRGETINVGEFQTHMVPVDIHGYNFCINPNFVKCWVTKYHAEVVPNKVVLRNTKNGNCWSEVLAMQNPTAKTHVSGTRATQKPPQAGAVRTASNHLNWQKNPQAMRQQTALVPGAAPPDRK